MNSHAPQTGVATIAVDADAVRYARANRRRFLEELKQFIRIPSVSALPRHREDVRRCAEWLASHLQRIGMEDVRIIPTPGSPLVYAAWRRAPGRPTVLIYGHYDVQPADPVDQWRTPPFEPVVRGDNLYGRGANDDKGQLFTHVKALESLLKTQAGLPVNVTCLFEGEEEVGSTHLEAFLTENRRRVAADVAVMSDTSMLAPNRPAITYALRGDLALELIVRGPERDLHSGNYGGAVPNPLQALCEMVAHLHDADRRIAIPGFYDRIPPPQAAERREMAANGLSDAQILRNARASHGLGERGYSAYERMTLRPALTVTGVTGGYQGPGVKSVLPAQAAAKIGIRLVPDQEPAEIAALLRRYIRRITPPGIHAAVRVHKTARPGVIDRRHPSLRAAARAYRRGFGVAPVLVRSGGTIPIVNMLQQQLGIPTVLMGFGLPDDHTHAPNEKFYLPHFFRGIETGIWFLKELGRE